MKKELDINKDDKLQKSKKQLESKELSVTEEKKPESKELTVADENKLPAKTKKSKPEKMFSVKKLPSLFKKKYTQKAFKKKILSKLYVEADKKLIVSLFTEQEFGKKQNKFWAIPQEKQFTKKQIDKLKKIASEVKKQKGSIKWFPLIFVVCVIVAVFLCTDLILKIGLQKTLQGVFGAKVSTSYVHLDYLNSSVSIKNLVVANEKEPMKNLFQFDSLIFDIDINRIFEKSFVVDEFEATGFALGTDRKTSGALPEKQKKEKPKKESKPITLPPFAEDLKNSAVNELGKLFESYKPDTILQNINNSLKTPTVANQIITDVNAMIPYWQNMPSKMEQDINSLQANYTKVYLINVSNITDINEIKENIELATRTIKSTKSIADSYKSVYSKLNSDTDKIKKMTNNLDKAIKDDTKLATNLTSKLTSISPSTSLQFLTSTAENYVQAVVGEYYPLIKEGLSYVETAKGYLPTKKEKAKKTKIARLPGETVTWGRAKSPTVHVKKAHASGTGFDVTIEQISTQPDLSGFPTTLTGSYAIQNRVDSFNAKLDLRSNPEYPVLEASYFADEHPFSFDLLDANTTFEFNVKADSFTDYTLSGFANITNAIFKLPKFEPEFAYNLCNDSAKSIDSAYLGMTGSYSESKGLALNISTDFDKNFIRAVSVNMSKEIAVIKDKAVAEVSNKLGEYKKPIEDKLAEFNQYKAVIEEYKRKLDSMINELNAKKAEFEKAVKEKTTSSIKQGIGDALKKLF